MTWHPPKGRLSTVVLGTAVCTCISSRKAGRIEARELMSCLGWFCFSLPRVRDGVE